MIVCVDFDGVLHDTSTVPPGKRLGRPMDGARQACWDLVHAGHKLVLHSSRSHSEDMSWAERWLAYWDFPPFVLSFMKPRADIYLDDKGWRFESWEQLRHEASWSAVLPEGL